MKRQRQVGLAAGAAMALILATITTMVPAQAADVTITAGSGDLPITQVVLSTGTQNTQPVAVTDGDTAVTISSITVTDGGVPVLLNNFNTSSITTSNYNFPAGLSGVKAYENGASIDVSEAGFQAAVEDVLTSLDLRDYLAYDSLTIGGTPIDSDGVDEWGYDFDVAFEAPLRNSDYVLVAERFGNTFFDLVALDKDGAIIPGARIVGFDELYGWNTGFAPSEHPTQPTWFTVVDVEVFNVDTTETPIYGFRIDNNGEADVKFFGLSEDPFLPAMSLEKTVYAGHDGGASCPGGELATVADGADVTYCFAVTNTGEADLDDLTITDADLGLTNAAVSSFTVVSGSLPLEEGDSIVLAYDATVSGAVVNTATATTTVLLNDGNENTVLSPETATDTAEVAIAGAAPASISGSVVDNNGAPIAGVTITLTGTSSDTTTTDASGDYSFTGLAAGTYTVSEDQPAGYADGGETAGTIGGGSVGDDSVDDVISGIVLAAGDDSIDNDFDEVIVPGTISGTVVDQNGQPIAGVAIALSGSATDSTTTGADGTYAFTGLVAGTYTVTETTPAGMADGGEVAGSLGGTVTDDVIADIVLDVNEGSVGNDFDESIASIAGTVVDQDGAGISGVSIVLTGTDPNGAVSESTTTDASGDYSFDQLLAGTYTITETTPSGYTDGGETAGSTGGDVTDDVIGNITLPAGVDSIDNDFDENVIPDPASISGTVVDDLGRPIPGVTVTLSGDVDATTVTGADGSYTFTGLPAGTYAVSESQPVGYDDGSDTAGSAGGTVTNDMISQIVLVGGQNSVDNDFAETTASIGGTVVDQNGAGIAGVTITLSGTDDAGQPVSLTTTTDGNGDYAFDGLLSGTYTITESQPVGFGDGEDTAGSTGGTVTNDVISEIVLAAGVASVDNDFAEVLQVATPEDPDLPDTGSETPLIVAYGLLFVVSGAILTLTASTFGRRRRT